MLKDNKQIDGMNCYPIINVAYLCLIIFIWKKITQIQNALQYYTFTFYLRAQLFLIQYN